MSIDNYSELKTALENWLDRTDLNARIPEFIQLAEVRIQRLLRPLGIEGRAYTTMVSGQEYYTLPTDFLSCRNVQVNSNPVRKLVYRSPEQLDHEYPYSESGTPKAYTIIGTELQIKPLPSSTDNLEIAYFKKITPLSDANTTNWTITNAPDLILYGSLIEAEAYLVNDPRVGLWKNAYDEALSLINTEADKGRYSGSQLQIRTATGNP